MHYRYRDTFYNITVKRVSEAPEHVVRVIVDGTAVDDAGAGGTGQPHGRIPLVDDRVEHYVEVELS